MAPSLASTQKAPCVTKLTLAQFAATKGEEGRGRVVQETWAMDLPSALEEEKTEPLVEELVLREGSKSRRVGGEEVDEENNDKAVFDVASVEECIERVIDVNTMKFELRKKEQEEAKMLKTSRKRLKSDERPELVQCGYCHYSTRISVGLVTDDLTD